MNYIMAPVKNPGPLSWRRYAAPVTVRALLVTALLASLSGCTGRSTLIPKDRLLDGIDRKMYSSMSFDESGRPVFLRELASRPGEPGSLYHVLDVDGPSGRMTRAFSVSLVRAEDGDFRMRRPLKVIYKWTGKGFEMGVKLADHFIEGSIGAPPGGLVVVLVAIPVSIVVLTAQGMTTGVIKGVAGEIERPFLKANEVMTGYMKFTYDDTGRLAEFLQLTPEACPYPLVKTTFHYSGSSTVPQYAESLSIPDGKVRIIRRDAISK